MRPDIAARLALASLLVLLLASLGCGPKDFAVFNPRMCKTVDAQGNPKDPTNNFTTLDGEANLYFEYRNAPANTTITCELVYTDPQNTRYTLSQDLDLTPGSHKGRFQLRMPGDEALWPGSYEVTLFRGEAPLGSPLNFTVASVGGRGAAAPAASSTG